MSTSCFLGKIRKKKKKKMETFGMKYQILFSGKNEKNMTNLSSAELAQRVGDVNSNISRQLFLSFFFFFCSLYNRVLM